MDTSRNSDLPSAPRLAVTPSNVCALTLAINVGKGVRFIARAGRP
jgi:hypothetical protein